MQFHIAPGREGAEPALHCGGGSDTETTVFPLSVGILIESESLAILWLMLNRFLALSLFQIIQDKLNGVINTYLARIY